MDIVDAQIHLWQAEVPDRPWSPGRAREAQKPYPMSKETVLFQMDLAGVRTSAPWSTLSVHVAPSGTRT
jgi:predicted TIM-barrel fold metal-dependent hydrolase